MPERRFTVCDVVQAYAPQSGGVKRYVHDKMRFFEGRDDVRHVLIAPAKHTRRSEYDGGSTHFLASPRIPFSQDYRLLLDTGRIKKVLQRERPHAVEVGNPYQPAWAAIAACGELGVPVLGFYHSDFPRSLGSKIDRQLRLQGLRPCDRLLTPMIQHYLRRMYNRMDAVITATEDFKKLLESFGIQRVVQIPLGTDTQVFRPVPEARQRCFAALGLPDEAVLLLYVGRFAGMKNLSQLLEAVESARLRSQRPLHLLCIGEGEYAAEVDAAAAQKDHVHRMPYLAHQEELALWYTGADLFVHAGDRETFGLVSVEAQACGTRVVAVQGGGMDSTLEGEEPFVVAKSPAPQIFADALLAALELDPDEERGPRAAVRRQRIQERFSREASYCRLLGLYRHLAAGRPAREYQAVAGCSLNGASQGYPHNSRSTGMAIG